MQIKNLIYISPLGRCLFIQFSICILQFAFCNISPPCLHATPLNIITHGPRTHATVALTFDDGPNPEKTPKLLKLLDTLQVKATFFVVGTEALKYPELIQRMIQQGHELANHTYDHQRLDALDDDQVKQEIYGGKQVVDQLNGQPVKYFRPPGGRYNLGVLETLSSANEASVHWTINGSDVELKAQAADEACDHLIKRIQAGDIVLLHNAPLATLAMLPRLVEGLHQKGLGCVTVGALLASPH